MSVSAMTYHSGSTYTPVCNTLYATHIDDDDDDDDRAGATVVQW